VTGGHISEQSIKRGSYSGLFGSMAGRGNICSCSWNYSTT